MNFLYLRQPLFSVDHPPMSPRIIGGKDAEIGQIPYQCSLQKTTFSKDHFCSCAIISAIAIITAAHCLQGYCIFVCDSYLCIFNCCYQIYYFFKFRKLPQHIEVLVGTNKLSGSGGTRYKANETIWHDFYYSETLAYDIALLRVDTPIEFNKNVQPITYSAKEVPPNAELFFSGWGKTSVSKFCELDTKKISNFESMIKFELFFH